jgi:hypothetical protein
MAAIKVFVGVILSNLIPEMDNIKNVACPVTDFTTSNSKNP